MGRWYDALALPSRAARSQRLEVHVSKAKSLASREAAGIVGAGDIVLES